MAEALRRRGVDDPAAILAAETGITIFRVAFERWVDQANRQDLHRLIHDSLEELRAVVAAQEERVVCEHETHHVELFPYQQE